MNSVAERVIAARNGDQRALESLLKDHHGMMQHLAMKHLRKDALHGYIQVYDEAQDILQQAQIYIWQHLSDCDPERFSGWVKKIIETRSKSRVVNLVRKHEDPYNDGGFYGFPESSPVSPTEMQERVKADREWNEDVEANRVPKIELDPGLLSLPPVQNRVVCLSRDGFSISQIADKLEMSENAVKNARHKAKIELGKIDARKPQGG